MDSSAFFFMSRRRSASAIALIITRILPSRICDSSWTSMAILSSSSVMKPWETRKWPRYSRSEEEEVDAMRPS